MANLVAGFVLETANAPGTNASVNLAGAATGRRTFSSAFSSGSLVFYYIDDGTQAEWGSGTTTAGSPDTLSRDTVIGNTAGTTARLNFAGAVRVYNQIPAERTVILNATGDTVMAQGALFDPFAGGVPIGAGLDYWGTAAPSGWLFPYGQAISRTTYAKAFALFGTIYGTGDGSTTFNLPDKRDRSSIGKGDMGGTAAGRVTAAIGGVDTTALGAAGGSESMPAHSHGISQTTHAHGVSDPTHAHSTSDPEHNHAAPTGDFVTDSFPGSGPATGDSTGTTHTSETSNSPTGLGVVAAATGLSINGASANVAVVSAGIGDSGNLPPGIVCNYIIFVGV